MVIKRYRSNLLIVFEIASLTLAMTGEETRPLMINNQSRIVLQNTIAGKS